MSGWVLISGRDDVFDALAENRQVLFDAVSQLDAQDTTRRKQLAVYLTSLSPEFQIQR